MSTPTPVTTEQVLPQAVRDVIDSWLEKYPPEQKQSAVITALYTAQEHAEGWLTKEMMDAVADYLDMPPVSVYEIGTFYSMLELEPVGRNIVAVCNNISCMLCGADDIVTHIENKLDIKWGGTSSDGRITLKKEEECLAACVGAPMMTVNGHYHEHLTLEKVDQILDGLE